MQNSIEAIWKEGFLNEKSLVAPKVNDLYNQKSKHLVYRVNRMFKVNLAIIIACAIIFPVVYYVLDFLWQGASASLLLFLTAWYNHREMRGIKTIDQGSTSLDYLKSFNNWLKDALLRGERIARFSYPVYVLIALSTMWSAWDKNGNFGKVPLLAVILGVLALALMIIFSKNVYRWELRLMYGRVFDKVEQTIHEMEKLQTTDYSIDSTSLKGNFEVKQGAETLLYSVQYKGWFSSEATTNFDGDAYVIKGANFWQTQFEVIRNETVIGKFSFNWKGEIVINYTNGAGVDLEMLFQYKGLWKFRFILSDRAGAQLLAMNSSWTNIKYNYDVSIATELFSEKETKELLLICGYSANLYLSMMSGVM